MEQACFRQHALAGWLMGAVAIITFSAGIFAAESDFKRLDAEVEKTLNEVVTLGADMAILEESRELSSQHQLLVLVSVDQSKFFRLDAIQLNIDNRTVSYHQYEEEELVALMNGGSQRLFWDDLPSGPHELTVSLFGSIPNDPDFMRTATHKIVIGARRSVVEMRVATGRNQVFPNLSIREWK
jgi:hypothetical protein